MVKVINEFVSKEEEEALLKLIPKSNIKVGVNRNSITRYGSDLPYKSRVKGEIPPLLQTLCERIYTQHLTSDLPDSVTINEYFPEQSIDWHVDSQSSGPIIVVLSLLSDAVMGLKGTPELRPIIKDELFEEYLKGQEVNLPRRSLLLLSGEERWTMKHCIFPVKEKRYSIVFRKGTPKTKI